MHNQEFLPEIEVYKVLCDFEIQTDHLFSARQADQVIVPTKGEPAEYWTLPY